MNPRPESRIKSLERRATDIEAAIEELSDDTAEALRDLKQGSKALFQHVQKGFDQAHAFVEERFNDINARFDTVEGSIAGLTATQAEQGSRLDTIDGKLDQQDQLLREILARLPKQDE